MKILCRDYEQQDKQAVLSIVTSIIRDGDTYPLCPESSSDEIEAYWLAPEKRIFVAEHDGRILGTYYIRPNYPGLGDHIANAGFMVSKAVRGMGVGRAMGEDALRRAKSLGYQAMQFNYVVATNTASLKLWQSLDFQQIGRASQAFRHPKRGLVDAIMLYRKL